MRPNGSVTPPGSKRSPRAETPQIASAPRPPSHATRRETHSARHASRIPARSASASRGNVGVRRASAGIACRCMPVHILADTYVSRHDAEITAVLSIVLAGLAVFFIDRALDRRGRKLALAVAGGDLSPVAATRLRFIRRVVDVTIIGIGVT